MLEIQEPGGNEHMQFRRMPSRPNGGSACAGIHGSVFSDYESSKGGCLSWPTLPSSTAGLSKSNPISIFRHECYHGTLITGTSADKKNKKKANAPLF